MKLVSMIINIHCCFDCPYHSGGTSIGSPLYCGYMKPARQIFDSNGDNVQYEPGRDIAIFCPLPENQVVNYEEQHAAKTNRLYRFVHRQ